ncbi:hypothetical protein NEQG_01997 [Nematocida parisii ERTm3]|uniref:Uncharacterized protein n=1 Tax=Nematocida parisii (strain ERTm3) TaxID=935791 RepID=I3EFC8_NEMP3|nr:hypothetical protein NEQG_01997 [Nematocida parisii ERTm3]
MVCSVLLVIGYVIECALLAVWHNKAFSEFRKIPQIAISEYICAYINICEILLLWMSTTELQTRTVVAS